MPNTIDRAMGLPVIKQIEQPTAREDDEIRKIALKFLDKLWTKGGHLDGQTSITIKKNLLYDAKLAKEKIPRGLAFTALGSASLFVSLSAIATTAIPIAAPLIFAGVGAAFLAGGANTLYNSFKCWKNKKDGLKALAKGGYDTEATNN